MREELIYTDRHGTDCIKWDALEGAFGDSDLIPLWVADMDFKAPVCVRQALTQWAEQGLYGYYKKPDACDGAFIRWEAERHGYSVETDWLRFAPGIVTAVYWLTQAFSQPQDGVALLLPVYYPFFSAIEKTGRRIVGSHLINSGGVYTIDFDDFERRIVEEKVSLFIQCSPHNPVGRVWERWELERVADICRRHNVTILSDEIHQDIVLGQRRHIPMATVAGEGVITVTAASKTFSLAGLQNSTIIIPNSAMREQFDTYANQFHMTSGNMAGYIAVRAAYEGGGPWLESVLEKIRENYEIVRRAAEQIPHAMLSPLEGTYLAWLDLTACIPLGKTKELVQDTCRLAVNMGSMFAGPDCGGRYDRFIRLNLATSSDNVRRGCENLVAALGK